MPAPQPSSSLVVVDSNVSASTDSTVKPQVAPALPSDSQPLHDSDGAELETDSRPSELHARVFAGAQSVIDGASAFGQRGIALSVGAGIRAWSVALFGSAALGSTIDDRFLNIQLARHNAGVALQLEQTLGASNWRGALGVHAGAVLFARTSSAKSDGASATPSKLLGAAAFGPEAMLSWVPGMLGLGLHLALDVLPNAPSFALRNEQRVEVASHALWLLEPRISLGLEARL